MAWEAGIAAADVAGAAWDWMAPDAGRMWPGLALPVGTAAVGLRKRQQLFANDDDDTGESNPRASKKGRLSRPHLTSVSRPDGNQNMGLLTYQRQTQGRRGRSKRRVRRLARFQRRAALRGSSSNLIANNFPIILPASATTGGKEGLAQYTYYLPSLAQAVEQVAAVQAQQPGQGNRYTQSFSFSIPKQRFEFGWTPDWINHTTTASAAKLTLYKFTLKKKTPINDVISTPAASAPSGALADMAYYASTNYVSTIASAGLNGLPYDHMVGIKSRYSSTSPTPATYDATAFNDTKRDPLTVFESPAFMGKVNLSWSRDFYIPYSQSMAFTCTTGPININYPDLEINRPENFVAKTATSHGDNFITPFLPAGWPIFVLKVQKHNASATVSITNFDLADAISVSHRMYYRVPNFPGRMLDYNNASTGSNGSARRYANVIGTANGTGKTDAYTGLNI